MAKWKNKGAPFTTEDGERIESGQVFSAHPDSRTVVMRRGKLALATVADLKSDDHTPWKPGYPGVDFGSDRAYEVARDTRPPLTPADFDGRTGSGQEGSFLVSDVRSMIAEKHG